ncbi:T9SS type A sorting domain-containing protein [Candidatus Marinimicrobia bacterium]|nr:T9SS type A sorting domain-containing protein [Candidatus Neomarinimicrobiota bacterium]MDC3333804.1 T9SS type A sorting domain-containing protein [Candidatus Neomarinimicrobiota bacterium]
MKKLLFVFLSIIINFSILPAQSIEGNFELDSLVVEYTIVARDIEQVGNDGNVHTTTYDEELATYDVTIGWPVAGDSSTSNMFNFSLPYFDIGDTMAVTTASFGSAEDLAAADSGRGIGLNVDFSDGAYTINVGSIYPTTNTNNCVTTPVFVPLQDAGTWTNGGFDPKLLPGNKVKWGWGIITSGVFATFEAPNMVTDVLGTNYGAGTPMESWGYIQANYTDDTYSTVDGLNIGWEAHDSEAANLGIVSDGDPFFVQTEADLGLMNGMLGRSALPVDSVTIPALAALAASNGITIHVPTENTPFAAGATGIDFDQDGIPEGATSSDFFYVFDPTGDVLGGGDGVPFSGDEGLQHTGYYATWNTLITLNGITDGVQASLIGGALANPAAPNIPMIVDSVLAYTLYYWDMSDATIDTMVARGVPAAATAQVGTWLAAGMGLADVGNALLPYIQGTVVALNAAEQAAGNPALTHSNGALVNVNDSAQDLDIEDFDYDSYYYYDELVNHVGGRIYAQSYANCFPAKWTQRVNSHWTYMGALSAVDDNSITVDRFELKGNYPNPFNPTTKIRFTNDRSSNVKVTVYALTGEKVATIMNKSVNAGAYDVSWNGRNTNGKIVPTGMYLYDIESDGRRLQGKMLFLK